MVDVEKQKLDRLNHVLLSLDPNYSVRKAKDGQCEVVIGDSVERFKEETYEQALKELERAARIMATSRMVRIGANVYKRLKDFGINP